MMIFVLAATLTRSVPVAVVVVVDPLACAELMTGHWLTDLRQACWTLPPDVPVAAPEDGAAPDAEPPDGVKVPVRFQKAEKLLKGPPTTWLDHCKRVGTRGRVIGASYRRRVARTRTARLG